MRQTNLMYFMYDTTLCTLCMMQQVEGAKFSEEDIKALTHRIQFGGDEVVQAKDGAGSATLSMVTNYIVLYFPWCLY